MVLQGDIDPSICTTRPAADRGFSSPAHAPPMTGRPDQRLSTAILSPLSTPGRTKWRAAGRLANTGLRHRSLVPRNPQLSSLLTSGVRLHRAEASLSVSNAA